jgi:hypothetical protein
MVRADDIRRRLPRVKTLRLCFSKSDRAQQIGGNYAVAFVARQHVRFGTLQNEKRTDALPSARLDVLAKAPRPFTTLVYDDGLKRTQPTVPLTLER